jgi:hypothetical protein
MAGINSSICHLAHGSLELDLGLTKCRSSVANPVLAFLGPIVEE